MKSAPRKVFPPPLMSIVSITPETSATVNEACCEVLVNSLPVAVSQVPKMPLSHSSDRYLLRKVGEIIVELLDDSKGHPYLELDASDDIDFSPVFSKNRSLQCFT